MNRRRFLKSVVATLVAPSMFIKEMQPHTRIFAERQCAKNRARIKKEEEFGQRYGWKAYYYTRILNDNYFALLNCES